MNYRDYIARDPGVCGGQLVVRDTRVPVRTVLASLAEGAAVQEILDDFPTLTEESVRAVIAFAAISAEEELAEDADDLAAFEARKNEPTMTFEDFVKELKREGIRN